MKGTMLTWARKRAAVDAAERISVLIRRGKLSREMFSAPSDKDVVKMALSGLRGYPLYSTEVQEFVDTAPEKHRRAVYAAWKEGFIRAFREQKKWKDDPYYAAYMEQTWNW